MVKTYISLGANMGDRLKYLNDAVSAMRLYRQFKLRNASSIYESEPWGKSDQEKFLNCVVEIDTSFSPHTYIGTMQVIENRLGRQREEKWGPRTIDIDVLLYGNEIFDTSLLTVPHPRMLERDFVLLPLRDIAPDLIHPVAQKSIRELAEVLSQKVLKSVGELDYFVKRKKMG